MGKSEGRPNQSNLQLLSGVLLGGLLSLAICLTGLFIVSVAVASGKIGEVQLSQLTLVCCAIGSFCGAKFSMGHRTTHRRTVALLVGLLLPLLLAGLGFILWRDIRLDTHGLAIAVASLCGGAVAGLLGRHAHSKKRKRKPKHKG